VHEVTVYIMASVTKQTKMAAYESPSLTVGTLTEQQYADLTREQHTVSDWNIILVVIRDGKFENDLEFEEVKKRASKKQVFSQAFTPGKKVKFTMGGVVEDAGILDLEAPAEVLALLKPCLPASEGEPYSLTGKGAALYRVGN
jgi:hypothetical protein